MTTVPIVQSLDAGQQEGNCKTRKMVKTEDFDTFKNVVIGAFRDRGHDEGDI
jgi:hypothetical protein